MNPYENIKEGAFTKQFKNRKPEYRHIKSLRDYAHFIKKNPDLFNNITKRRANFYINLIEKPNKSPLTGGKIKHIYLSHQMMGGKLSISNFQKMLKESYSKKPEEKIDDFIYDPEVSTDRAKVYHNPKTGQTTITHTGTDTPTDWLNNLAIATKTYKYTDRYKKGQKAQEATEKKYGKENVSTLGHSQGSRLAEIHGKDSKEILTLNKASTPFEKYTSPKQTDIRSSGDVVSGIQYLNPFAYIGKKNKAIEIKKESYNPIKEHSPDVLSRLDPNMIIGEGRKKMHKSLKLLLKN